MSSKEIQAAVEANTAAIEQLTSTVNVLVSKFIRPNAQQAFSNYERLERIEGIVLSIAEQQQVSIHNITANTEQISAIGDRIEAFDDRLEETRALVAENGSRIAQLSVKQERSSELIAHNGQQITELRHTITELRHTVEASQQETEALKELSRTQLAGIIANGRRIDRLEQQAS